MTAFVKLFVDICFFKKGPQDIPASSFLFRLVLLAYFLIGVSLLMLQATWLDAVIQALAEAGVTLGFIWLTLLVSHKAARFQQTATAMLGTDALISIGALPLLVWLEAGSSIQFPYPYILLLGLMLWHLAIVSHILRHALSKPLSLGVGVAILYVLVSYQVMSALFANNA